MTTPHTITVPSVQPTEDPFHMTFPESCEAVEPSQDDTVHLQWLNGLATEDLQLAVGLHAKRWQNVQFDETMEALGVTNYTVTHSSHNEKGEPNRVSYWALNYQRKPLSVFILAVGLVSQRDMNASIDNRLGVAYGWMPLKDSAGNPIYKPGTTEQKTESRLMFRGYVAEWYAHGFQEPVTFTLSRSVTKKALPTLNANFAVIKAYKEHRASQQEAVEKVPYYAFSLPLVPGPIEVLEAPKKKEDPKEGQKQGEAAHIYPMLAAVPSPVTPEYMREHHISEELRDVIDRQMAEAIEWSKVQSRRIVQGTILHVAELPVALPEPKDLLITSDQLQKVLVVCNRNPIVIKSVCQTYGIESLEQMRQSQFASFSQV